MSLVSRNSGSGSADDIFHPAKPAPAAQPAPRNVQQPSPALAQAFKAAYAVANNQHGGNIPKTDPAVETKIKAGIADGSITVYGIRNPDGSPGRTEAYVKTSELPNPSAFFIKAPTWGGAIMAGPIELR